MNTETLPPEDKSIGTLLKNERERKGLSREHVAKTIRLRLHFIAALEEEDWGTLPAPVFIKGFIRSYSQFLGMDPGKAIALYEEKTGIIEESPRPLVAAERTGKMKILVPLAILIILAAVLYLWFQSSSPDIEGTAADSDRTEETVSAQHNTPEDTPMAMPEAEEPDPADLDSASEAAEAEGPPEPQDAEKEIDQETADTAQVMEKAEKEVPVTEVPDQPAPVLPEPVLKENQAALTPDIEEVQDLPEVINEEDPDLQTLDAVINMRSYIKIYVDDKPAKEYMFRPGSRPQWRAKKGFDILVGNAAGVEFTFNGKPSGKLGALGKVVRVRFPEDFESSIYED